MTLGITKGSTVPKPNGIAFLDEYGEHIETLYETGSRPLTAVGGTANVVTATMAIDLTAAGLVDGLCVSITWAAANTAGVTLAINGGAAIPVLDPAGGALPANTLSAGLTSILRYTAGSWRIISAFGLAAASVTPSVQIFTASGTWTKPVGYDPDTQVMVELWAAGGGGARVAAGIGAGGGGGGGGGYIRGIFRYADLPSSVSITIGAGGIPAPAANGNGGDGGNSLFGSFMTAYGGGGGIGGSPGNGGGGGGLLGAAVGASPGRMGGGVPGSGFTNNNDAVLPWAGGGGKTGAGISLTTGGATIFGGGGGAGANGVVALGGTSVFGGRGGNAATGTTPDNGVAPGGGGGGAAPNSSTALAGAGARGECRIWIMGN